MSLFIHRRHQNFKNDKIYLIIFPQDFKFSLRCNTCCYGFHPWFLYLASQCCRWFNINLSSNQIILLILLLLIRSYCASLASMPAIAAKPSMTMDPISSLLTLQAKATKQGELFNNWLFYHELRTMYNESQFRCKSKTSFSCSKKVCNVLHQS